MKTKLFSVAFLCLALACKPTKKETKTSDQTESTTIIPENMPNELCSGHKFPTDSILVNSWIKNSKIVENLETNSNIINHGWDIWKALTDFTKQRNNGQKLRRFETWYTPDDIKAAFKEQLSTTSYALKNLKKNHTGLLSSHNQLHHNIKVSSSDVVGFVKYDPSAANHIYNNKLYFLDVLKSKIKHGEIARIPDFPSSGVVIKPVFHTLKKKENGLENEYTLPVWPGYHNQYPLDSVNKNGFGPKHWSNDVTVTIDGVTEKETKTYSINDFIHFKLSKEQAKGIKGTKAGDYLVLAGMHVNTRENRRWTWQTFWWSENSDQPQSPSSTLIASKKPEELEPAAKHYAMSLAYNMVSPVQPYNGGTNNNVSSIYAFNPYLEAGFGNSVFDDAISGGGNDTIQKYYGKEYQKINGKLNNLGIHSNCMSCHGQARIYDVKSPNTFYIADQYFELDAEYFKSTVALDFTWSIQGNLIDGDANPISE